MGNKINLEWLHLLLDYYVTTKGKDMVTEIILPILVSFFVTTIYFSRHLVFYGLEGLSNILPTVMSFLIGFTVMLITLLMTINGDSVKTLKDKESGKILHEKEISLFQCLLIQFAHILFSEVVLMLLVFLYMFWNGIGMPLKIAAVVLFLQVYQVLNILFSTIRGVTNLYFSFFKQK